MNHFTNRYAAIYLCAGMETLLEEIALTAAGCSAGGASGGAGGTGGVGGAAGAGGASVTPAAIDHAVANTADLWGLLQPYSHLNAGRIASGIPLR